MDTMDIQFFILIAPTVLVFIVFAVDSYVARKRTKQYYAERRKIEADLKFWKENK